MKKLYALTLISLFIVPFSSAYPILGADVWYSQFIALFLVLFVGLALALWKFNKYISMFLLLCLFSTVWTHNGEKFICTQNPRQMLCLIQLYGCCYASWVISKFSSKQREILLKTMLVVVFIQGAWVVLQYYNLDPIFNGFGTYMTEGRVDDTVGFSGSHNQIGVFFAVTSSLVIAYFPYLLPLTIFGLWNSTTSAAWLGFLISSLFICWNYSKKAFIGIVCVLAVSTAIFYSKFEGVSKVALQERVDIIKHSMIDLNNGKAVMTRKLVDGRVVKQEVTCTPLLGFGFSNFMQISPYTQREYLDLHGVHVYSHAHNDYIEIVYELGSLGAVALLLLLSNFLYNFIKARKTKILLVSSGCILAQMICALGVFTVHTALSGFLLVLMYGIFKGEIDEQGFKV